MNTATKAAGLVINVLAIKKQYINKYKLLEIEEKNLRFKDGDSVYIYTGSMIEQLFEYLLINLKKMCTNTYDDETDKEADVEDDTKINRDQILKVIEKDNELSKLLYTANKQFDKKKSDGNNYMINEKTIVALLDKYMPEGISLTSSSSIYVRYLIDYVINACIDNALIIKKRGVQKSMTLEFAMSAIEILYGELFEKFDKKASGILEKLKNTKTKSKDKDDPKAKGKTKNKKKDESDDEESEDEEED